MLQFHKILLHTNSYYTLCIAKHGIFGPEYPEKLQLLEDFAL